MINQRFYHIAPPFRRQNLLLKQIFPLHPSIVMNYVTVNTARVLGSLLKHKLIADLAF